MQQVFYITYLVSLKDDLKFFLGLGTTKSDNGYFINIVTE